jgi:SAM-dependent methyltransferase
VPDLLRPGLPLPPGNRPLALEEQRARGVGADLPRVPAFVSPPLLGHPQSRLDKLVLVPTRRVNCDKIAAEYDRRFEGRGPRGVTEALTSLAEADKARRVLEVGCGAGHWLHALRPVVASCHGLDLSRGMLERARGRGGTLALS